MSTNLNYVSLKIYQKEHRFAYFLTWYTKIKAYEKIKENW